MTGLLFVTGILCSLLASVESLPPPVPGSSPRPSKSLQCKMDAFQAVKESNSSGMVVEICHDGEWKRVCRDDDSEILASAVCKQMLYSSGVLMPGAAYNHTGQLVVVELECPSSDTPHTRNCSVDVEDDDHCSSGHQVEIQCSNSYLSFLPPGYYPATGSFAGNISTVNIEVNSNYVPSIPYFTNDTFSLINVLPNGVIILESNKIPNARSLSKTIPEVAPFWTVHERGKNLRVSVEVFAGAEHNYLSIVSSYISNRTKTSFHGDWLTIVDWDKATSSQEFHYQGLLVSDHITTYAIFTYKCSMNLPDDALGLIGTNIPNKNRFRYSRSSFISHVGCLNGNDQPFYNLFYELAAPGRTYTVDPNIGSCVSAGFNETSCCQPLTDPTEHCRTGTDTAVCYCDAYCIERGDCCHDIHNLTQIHTCIPSCIENTVRLFNQSSSQHGSVYGYLRICASGVWQPVCDDSWNNTDARMVCELMGYADGLVTRTALRPDHVSFIYSGIMSVDCSSNEGSAMMCSYNRTAGDTCTERELIILECTTDSLLGGPAIPAQLAPTSATSASDLTSSSNGPAVTNSTLITTSDLQMAVSSTSNDAVLSVTPTASTNQSRTFNSSTPTMVVQRTNSFGEPVVITVSVCVVVLFAIILVSSAFLIQRKMRNKQSQELEPRVVTHRSSMVLTNSYIQRGRPSMIKPEHIPMVSDKFLILNKQLRLIDPIGQGGFGVVYKAHLFDDGTMTIVAVKTLKGNFDEQLVHEMVEESVRMKTLVHPNVMSLLGVCLDGGPAPYIVLPFMRNGSVLDHLKQNRSSVLLGSKHSDDEVTVVQKKLLTMCLQIAKGMEYLASRKLVHRDLAARNCMIDETGIIKVADFGLAKSTYDKLYFRQNKEKPVKLPIKWMAVESIEDGVFSEKSDVWSFGITCWEVFNGGRIPYGGIEPLNLPCLLQQGHRMDRPLNAACSDNIYQVTMMQCWNADTTKRPNFSLLVGDIDKLVSAIAGYLTMGNLISDAAVETDQETAV